MPDQELNRAASSDVVKAITNFCKSRMSYNPLFFMSDLTRHVSNYPSIKVAPSSPDRILRHLRAQGKIRYECVSRSKSMYKVLAVA